MGLIDGKLVINPENGNRFGADLDLVIASSESVIPMIEAGANQVPEETVLEALKIGFAENKKIIALINDLVKEVGHAKIPVPSKDHNPELLSAVQKAAKDLKDETEIEPLVSSFDSKDQAEVKEIVEELFSQTFRKNILAGKRADGRKLDEIRPLSAEVGVLPRVHGSAIFQRGETQALTVTTLGAPSLSQSLESAEGEETKRYMHHYNFPPFSTGETGRMGSPGRREIGHGALAERALAPVIPTETDFPYAIRVVSEIMSSMAPPLWPAPVDPLYLSWMPVFRFGPRLRNFHRFDTRGR